MTISKFDNNDNEYDDLIILKNLNNEFDILKITILYIYKCLIENNKIDLGGEIEKVINSYKISWFINNINEKIKNSETETLYFILKNYKFKVVFYYNGYDIRNNTHLSLYIGTIKNKNDDKLNFPVNISYNFSLISPLNNSICLKYDESKIISLNEISKTKAFNRQIGDETYTWGRHEWFSKEDVKNYINNNGLIICLEIVFN